MLSRPLRFATTDLGRLHKNRGPKPSAKIQLFKYIFSRKVDSVLAVDFKYLNFYGIADIHHIFDLRHSFLRHSGNVKESFFARKNFNEGTYGAFRSAEDSRNLAFVDFSDFDILGKDFDFVLAGFGVCCILFRRWKPDLRR